MNHYEYMPRKGLEEIMIEVKNLTKIYGDHKAVDDLSFTIEDGKIYGFLGPNGAGKSTTMNIITGCLAATSGEVTIDGYDIFEDPIEAKKRIGYLPEIPPVYTDRTVYEYLAFVARARGVREYNIAEEVYRVMDATKVTEYKNRLIRHLSKGYRQRVGIAQALIGSPQVIILDEPTVGLDPQQIIEIRELISSLKKDHTVILSSHILSEVQAVCEEILIIYKGRKVAFDSTERLEQMFSGRMTVTVLCDGRKGTVKSAVAGLKSEAEISVTQVQDDPEPVCEVTVSAAAGDDKALCRQLFNAFSAAGLPILQMSTNKVSLEEVFIELTAGAQEEKVAKV